MTKGILAGALLAALTLATGAQAQSCASACNDKHSACTRAGKDYGACMGAWRQCKAACLTPARTSTAAPNVAPAVIRR